ncbi:MAG TPA: hypothetical protein VL137_10625 [Polyangiaceae bacterium]|nr:hypothetical protein [Polyangiaceae bacterium]
MVWLLRHSKSQLGHFEIWLLSAWWAVLPLKAENVAWISGRGDVLGAVVLFWGLHRYSKASSDLSRLCVGAMATLGALGSKEVYVISPLLFLLERWHQCVGSPRERLKLLARDSSLWLVAGLVFAFLIFRVGWVGLEGGGYQMLATLGFFDRVVLVFESIGHAAVALCWPWTPQLLRGPIGFEAPGVLAADPLMGILGVAAALTAFVTAVKFPRTRIALVMLVAPLLPVVNILPTGLESRMSDRYLYLPSLGLALLMGHAIHALCSRLQPRLPRARRWGLLMNAGLIVLATILLCQRVRQFAVPSLLWTKEAQRSDAAAGVLVNAAGSQQSQGHLLSARDLELRAAQRYSALGFAAGLPHALQAARLNNEYWGEQAPKSLEAYGQALSCLLHGRHLLPAIPFPPLGQTGVRFPCDGPEAEDLILQSGQDLQAELLMLRVRAGQPVRDEVQQLEQQLTAPSRAFVYLTWAWLGLEDAAAAARAWRSGLWTQAEQASTLSAIDAVGGESWRAGRLFIAGAYAPACKEATNASSFTPIQTQVADATCQLAGWPSPRGIARATRSMDEWAALRNEPNRRVALLLH